MNIIEQHDALYLGKLHTNSYAAWNRPQSPTSREEEELMQSSSRALSHTSDPAERLRLLCLSRGAGGIMGLGRVFRHMDEDGSRQLNKVKFFKVIKDTGLELADEETEELFQRFDSGNSGAINIDEFLSQIAPPMSDTRRSIVERAFKKLDQTGAGFIMIKHLRDVYDVTSHPRYMSGEESGDTILNKFVANFEQEGGHSDGRLTREEFLDYYSGTSVAIEHDSYFDLMIRQSYKL